VSGDDGVAQVEVGDTVRADDVPLRVRLEQGDRDDEQPGKAAGPARLATPTPTPARRRYGLIITPLSCGVGCSDFLYM
jgi:hypothetical protein